MNAIDKTWRTSSYSNSKGGNCVEIASTAGGGAAVRDSRHRGLGHLAFPAAEWAAFLLEVKTARP